MLSKERAQKIKSIVAKRQHDLTIILENVHDPHNVGAALRSCEAIGINEVFIVYTEEGANTNLKYVGRNAASGVHKWLKCHFFSDLNECIQAARQKSERIFSTHLGQNSTSIYEMDLTKPTAFLFGSEHEGVSPEALSLCDGNMIIPMEGMAQSLNVSVACSIALFETMRQRKKNHMYDGQFDEKSTFHSEQYYEYLQNTKPRIFEADPKNFRSLFD